MYYKLSNVNQSVQNYFPAVGSGGTSAIDRPDEGHGQDGLPFASDPPLRSVISVLRH